MNLTGLDLLFLEVNNLEESLHFYTSKLGFKVISQDLEAEPPMATLQAGTLKIKLAQHLETMLRRGRGVSLFLGVDDIDQYFKTLSEREVEVNPPIDEGWGGRFITLEDPDKYRYFFVTWSQSQDTHRRDAEIADEGAEI
jgi:catechol 2,3-dioxygenase-like lactoylglutathione lyase family enzyme